MHLKNRRAEALNEAYLACSNTRYPEGNFTAMHVFLPKPDIIGCSALILKYYFKSRQPDS